MKAKTLLFCGILGGILEVVAGDFVNLNFDDPDLTRLKYYFNPENNDNRLYGKAEDLFRGWQVMQDGKPYNGLIAYSIGQDGGIRVRGAQMSLSADNYTLGKYSVGFSAIPSADVPPRPSPSMALSLVGKIPEIAYYLAGVGYATALVNGVPLAETRPTDFLFPYWDVHEYAGKEVELSLYFNGGGLGSTGVDLIGFTIPEPSTWAMLVGGSGVLGLYLWLGKR